MSKIQKKLISSARRGILASMIFVYAGTAFAQTTSKEYSRPIEISRNASGMHLMHRFNSHTKVKALASGLGLKQNTIKKKLRSGKNIKQIMQDYGITMDQLDA